MSPTGDAPNRGRGSRLVGELFAGFAVLLALAALVVGTVVGVALALAWAIDLFIS